MSSKGGTREGRGGVREGGGRSGMRERGGSGGLRERGWDGAREGGGGVGGGACVLRRVKTRVFT